MERGYMTVNAKDSRYSCKLSCICSKY